MDSVTAKVFRSLDSYWRRRTYQRLEGVSSSSKKRVVRLGGGSHRSWKVKVVRPMFRLRIPSPMKLFCRLRDAYVNAMMVLAGEKQRAAALAVVKKAGKQEGLFMRRNITKALQINKMQNDFERRMMVHIYNSLVASREILNSETPDART